MLLADQFDDGFEVFLIARVEIIQLGAIHIEHQLRFALYDQRHYYFRFRQAAAGDMARELVDIGYELGFALTRGCAANGLLRTEWRRRRAGPEKGPASIGSGPSCDRSRPSEN
jgi:hypothetical protein